MWTVLRFSISALCALFGPLLADACEMSIDARGTSVAEYVEAARPCLTAAPYGYAFDQRMEGEFLTAVNRERNNRGLPAFALRNALKPTARFHSLDMAANGFFGHVGPDTRTVGNRVAALDRTALVDIVAENVAKVEVIGGVYDFSGAADHLHKSLMDSPGHRKNILHKDATHIAIGVVANERGVYVTQVFMRLVGTLDAPVPVRLRAGQPLPPAPYLLQDWEFQSWKAERAPGDYVAFHDRSGRAAIGTHMRGDVGLAAYGTRQGEKTTNGQLMYNIHLAGPDISIGG